MGVNQIKFLYSNFIHSSKRKSNSKQTIGVGWFGGHALFFAVVDAPLLSKRLLLLLLGASNKAAAVEWSMLLWMTDGRRNDRFSPRPLTKWSNDEVEPLPAGPVLLPPPCCDWPLPVRLRAGSGPPSKLAPEKNEGRSCWWWCGFWGCIWIWMVNRRIQRERGHFIRIKKN